MSWFLSYSKGFLPEKGTFTLNFAAMSDQLDNLYMKSFFFTFYLFWGLLLLTWSIARYLQTGDHCFSVTKTHCQILLASVTLIGRDNNKVIKKEEHCNTMFSETSFKNSTKLPLTQYF